MLGDSMRKIFVEETGNPTPERSWDYCATYDGYDGAHDAGHQCQGMGKTKEEAIENLKECCEDYE